MPATTAFTVVGYIAAESRGRREVPFARRWVAVALVGAVVVLAMELVAGWQVGPGASLLRAVAEVVAAVHGGWLYHLQRDHVRALLRLSAQLPLAPGLTRVNRWNAETGRIAGLGSATPAG